MEQNIQYDNEIATAETSASMDAASNTGEGYLIAQAIRSEFSGPLPHPEILAKYEDILPGAATRILEMAEEQANHRRFMKKKQFGSCRARCITWHYSWFYNSPIRYCRRYINYHS